MVHTTPDIRRAPQARASERLEPITAVNLRQAHKKVEMGSMMGKIVLEHFPT